jgi:hypothetical protein
MLTQFKPHTNTIKYYYYYYYCCCCCWYSVFACVRVESSWNVMAHGEAREGKWRGNWRMEWIASTLHTTSEHGVSSITTADVRTSSASNRLNWRPRRFKWIRPFRRKTNSGFCACAITFQTQSTFILNPGCISSYPSLLRIHIIYKFFTSLNHLHLILSKDLPSGPGSSVGIATAYGLDGPGIESRWGRDFSHLSRPALRPTQPPVQWVPGLSRE